MTEISIDHVVINTRYEMDEAAEQFASLGFTLTDRGYHTLGSINHLMMFNTDYLELIGLPAASGGNTVTRPGISDAPVGINGLVFKTADASQTYAHLQSVGMDGDPPKAFSRPVELGGQVRDASFRTIHVQPDAFAAGRLYFCEHLTPELVWQPQWQVHQNNSSRVAEVVIVSDATAELAERLSRVLGVVVSDGAQTTDRQLKLNDAVLSVIDAASFVSRYGDLARLPSDRSEFFGALVFRTENVDQAAQSIQVAGTQEKKTPRGVATRNDQFDSILEFVG